MYVRIYYDARPSFYYIPLGNHVLRTRISVCSEPFVYYENGPCYINERVNKTGTRIYYTRGPRRTIVSPQRPFILTRTERKTGPPQSYIV